MVGVVWLCGWGCVVMWLGVWGCEVEVVWLGLIGVRATRVGKVRVRSLYDSLYDKGVDISSGVTRYTLSLSRGQSFGSTGRGGRVKVRGQGRMGAPSVPGRGWRRGGRG